MKYNIYIYAENTIHEYNKDYFLPKNVIQDGKIFIHVWLHEVFTDLTFYRVVSSYNNTTQND